MSVDKPAGEEEEKLGNNGEPLVEQNEDAPDEDADYDRFVEECSEDLDRRLDEVLVKLRSENQSSIFCNKRRFWRAVMSKAEYNSSMINSDELYSSASSSSSSSTDY